MRLTVLGSGTAVPRAERGSPAHLVELGEGERVLLDLGPGGCRQLARLGVRPRAIRRVLISHHHPDHTLDLVHLLFAANYPGELRTEPLMVLGPPGFRAFFAALCAPYGQALRASAYELVIDELHPGARRRFEGWMLQCAPTRHTEHSLAFRLTELGPGGRARALVYSGDGGYGRELVELARGADLLLMECSFPDGQGVPGHATPAVAARIAREAGVGRMVLVHLYPPCDEVDLLAQVRAGWDGPVELARDLARYEV
ncbi:MAG: MBL fold metallo-hydrolase [Planctomycetota bacterium]|nr:MAG: MBL fold metallo-hydrolase [Planctomycetota bacterium]